MVQRGTVEPRRSHKVCRTISSWPAPQETRKWTWQGVEENGMGEGEGGGRMLVMVVKQSEVGMLVIGEVVMAGSGGREWG